MIKLLDKSLPNIPFLEKTGKNLSARIKRKKQAEDSISLRVSTAAMAITGILAACQLADTPTWLVIFGIVGTIVGSIISYFRRNSNNYWLKWILAAVIILILAQFLQEMVIRVRASIADARAPLTNMLIGLQGLHCFDLPRRRDLNVSSLVGLVLIVSASSLSRDLMFGTYLFIFLVFGCYMLYLDCISRTIESTVSIAPQAVPGYDQATIAKLQPSTEKERVVKRDVRYIIGMMAILPIFGFITFALIPKIDVSILKKVQVSLKLDIPFLNASQINNPQLKKQLNADGSLMANPMAYYGFTNELDLNYRGELSDQVIMRVSSPRGQQWRAMAFDIYDGQQWKMSKPNKTYERMLAYGSAIPLSPLPSFGSNNHVPSIDLTQVFYIEAEQTNLIPCAVVPYMIHFPAPKIDVDSYGALRSPVLLEKDTVYTVFSRVPSYHLDTLRRARAPKEEVERRVRKRYKAYLQLPDSLPKEVRDLSDNLSAGATNWFNIADNINIHLKSNYPYDFKVGPTPKGMDVVYDFLFNKKRGYCEQFASSFVVMCRCQGIPARLVTGFNPGEYNPFTGLWEVRMKHAHAWAEAYIPNYGWVTFDPTPDGLPPGYSGTFKSSPFEYFFEKILELSEKLSGSNIIRNFIDAVIHFFDYISGTLLQTSNLLYGFGLPLAITIVSAVVLLSAVKLFKDNMLGPKKSTQMYSVQIDTNDPLLRQIAAEYLKFCRFMLRFNVARKPSETAEEFLNRLIVQLKGRSNPPDNLLAELNNFTKVYEELRFGNNYITKSTANRVQAESPDLLNSQGDSGQDSIDIIKKGSKLSAEDSKKALNELKAASDKIHKDVLSLAFDANSGHRK